MAREEIETSLQDTHQKCSSINSDEGLPTNQLGAEIVTADKDGKRNNDTVKLENPRWEGQRSNDTSKDHEKTRTHTRTHTHTLTHTHIQTHTNHTYTSEERTQTNSHKSHTPQTEHTQTHYVECTERE